MRKRRQSTRQIAHTEGLSIHGGNVYIQRRDDAQEPSIPIPAEPPVPAVERSVQVLCTGATKV